MVLAGAVWAVLGWGIGAARAQDAEPSWGGGGEVDTNYRYLWRGFYFSDMPAIQPSAWVWFLDGELSLWASLPLPGDEAALLELDPALAWTFYAGSVEIAPAVTGYLYPGDSGNTVELSVGATVPAGEIFSVYTTQVFDVVAAKGWYGNVGWSLAPAIGERVELEGKVELGFASASYHDYYAGVEKGGMSTAMVGVGATATFGAFYVRPHAELAYWFNEELAEAAGARVPFNAGLALGLDY